MQIESGCLVPRGLRGSRRPLDPLLLLGMLLALSWVPLAGLDQALGPAWWLGPLCSVSPALVTPLRQSGVHTGGLVWFEEVWSECEEVFFSFRSACGSSLWVSAWDWAL